MILNDFKLSDYADGKGGYSSPTGQGFDGVVKVNIFGIGYLTGSLLYNGKAILTAGHGFKDGFSGGSVLFQTKSGTTHVGIKSVQVNPDYNASTNNNDIAIVWLDGSAPIDAERYEISHTEDDLIFKEVSLAGYGMLGNGVSPDFYNGYSLRLSAHNRIDSTGDMYSDMFNQTTAMQFLIDYDDGTKAHDALGNYLNINYPDAYRSWTNLGVSTGDGFIGMGDSGGAAFDKNGVILGTLSYVMSSASDTDTAINGTYGEIAGYQRVDKYDKWIDQSIRANYVEAPKSAKEVSRSVVEGDSGTSYAYFYVESIYSGYTSTSVSYRTKDGTAKAGSDYIEQSGIFKLYQNEKFGVIAIEIIGDKVKEGKENFFLEFDSNSFIVYGSKDVAKTLYHSIDANGHELTSTTLVGQVIVDNDF